jgi:hypothetical protein
MPPGSMEWKVDTTDDMEASLIYSNLAYDLVGAAMAKLGVEYSKYILGKQDAESFNKEMTSAMNALKTETVVG